VLTDSRLAELLKANPHRAVKTHAMRLLGQRTKLADAAVAILQQALTAEDRLVQRAAVEAFAAQPKMSAVAGILQVQKQATPADTHLWHACKIAIRNTFQANPKELEKLSNLDADALERIGEAMLGLPTTEAGAFLAAHLELFAKRPTLNEVVRHIARYGSDQANTHLAEWLGTTNLEAQLVGYAALQRGRQEAGKPIPNVILQQAKALARQSLESGDDRRLQIGLDLVQQFRIGALRERVTQVAADANISEGRRGQAFLALTTLDSGAAVPVLLKVLLNVGEPEGVRTRAAQVMASVPAAHEALIQSLASIPARLGVVVANELALSPQGSEKLLTAVKAGKASGRLLQEQGVRQRLRERKLPDLDQRIAELTKGLPNADQKMIALMTSRRQGFDGQRADPVEGAKIFTKNCAICHQLGGQGAKIGPQLDGIGNRGLERLLEDILDPSRNVDQALRTTVVELKNGQVVSGLLLREEGQVLVFADAQGKEIRISKETIEERTSSLLSPMPANFADQVSEPEFYHLMAYLLQQRPKN